MRKAIVANCHKLVEEERFLKGEHHMFCLHLVDQSTQQYPGRVCHFNQCLKGDLSAMRQAVESINTCSSCRGYPQIP
jgi:hypothetical protein